MAKQPKSGRAKRSRIKKAKLSPVSHGLASVGESGLEIRQHVLQGSQVVQRKTPNTGGKITPRYLVFHYTAGKSAESSVAWLTNPAAKASAHLVLGRDGSITQLAPFNVKTWHAGRSHWDGLDGLNSHSIGIEMDNAGPLKQVGEKLTAWFGKTYPSSQAILAAHKFEQESRWWHAYTETQIGTAFELAKLLVNHYDLKEVIGHEDIAPDRKRDPGPAFPLEHIQAAVQGRKEETEMYRVTATSLNIRSGPGTEFPKVAKALKKRTKLILLEKEARWSRVEVEGKFDLEGWVFNKFIRRTHSFI